MNVIKFLSKFNAKIIDAQGKFISPGFVDIHIHGGGGFDFMDATDEAFLGVAQTHAKHGTTSMLVTTTTADKSLDMMSLFDYLGYAAGGELGKHVFKFAKERSVPMEEKHVANRKYTGKLSMFFRINKNFL